jgi:hypothetical protein
LLFVAAEHSPPRHELQKWKRKGKKEEKRMMEEKRKKSHLHCCHLVHGWVSERTHAPEMHWVAMRKVEEKKVK